MRNPIAARFICSPRMAPLRSCPVDIGAAQHAQGTATLGLNGKKQEGEVTDSMRKNDRGDAV